MIRTFRATCAAVAIPLVLATSSPAVAADADVFVITGYAYIAPGLAVTPAPQSLLFGGTAIVAGADGVLASYSCSFTATFAAGIVIPGIGTLSGSCGPLSFPVCLAVWEADTLSFTCASVPGVTATGVCEFVPSDVLPTRQYTFQCAGAYSAAP